MSKASQHVVPAGEKWKVRRADALRASGVYDTQQQAIDVAREAAKQQQGQLYIHGRDGRIRERDSYGEDTYPPQMQG